MPQMHIPVTDAFDDESQLESLEVEFTPKQIEWLERQADERGLSIDHMLRSIITAQIREDGRDLPDPSSSGDSMPTSSTPSPSSNGASDEADDDNSPPSIVESLRSASERLQDLTEDEEEEAEKSDLHDTLARLQAHIDSTPNRDESASDSSPGTMVLGNQNQSMFDMMDED